MGRKGRVERIKYKYFCLLHSFTIALIINGKLCILESKADDLETVGTLPETIHPLTAAVCTMKTISCCPVVVCVFAMYYRSFAFREPSYANEGSTAG